MSDITTSYQLMLEHIVRVYGPVVAIPVAALDEPSCGLDFHYDPENNTVEISLPVAMPPKSTQRG